MEADLRHAELIVEQIGLADPKTKAVATPAVDAVAKGQKEEDQDEELTGEHAKAYREIP